jgi:signal transduction histidine kinase
MRATHVVQEIRPHSAAAPTRPGDSVPDMEAACREVAATTAQLQGLRALTDTTLSHLALDDLLRALLQRVADHVALAVDRAHLYAAEQDARRQAEAARARAQASEAEATARAEQLHTILETLAEGVAVYDSEGRPLQQVNHAYRELFALERGPADYEALPTFERARLMQVRDAATGAPLPFEESPVGRALRGEVVTGPDADIRVRAFDGRELEVNSSAAPLRDREPDGRVAGAVLVLRDLTERNRLEHERQAARADELAAREANRRMEQFLATAAHDLRTPLSTTLGYLDLAERQTERLASVAATGREANPDLAGQVAAVRTRLEDADHSVGRLSRLLTRLFDTAAIRAGKLELHRAPHDLVALVREQVAALRVATPDRTIRLQEPRGGEPIPVEIDSDRIAEVVTNYLTNALKYSSPERPVNVHVAVRGGEGSGGQARMARVDSVRPGTRHPQGGACAGVGPVPPHARGQGARWDTKRKSRTWPVHLQGAHPRPWRAGRGDECGWGGLRLLVHPAPSVTHLRMA